jgi:hypothetical protein
MFTDINRTGHYMIVMFGVLHFFYVHTYLMDGSIMNPCVRFAKVFVDVYFVAKDFWKLASYLYTRSERYIHHRFWEDVLFNLRSTRWRP